MKLILVLVSILLLAACDTPHHTVIENGNMVIYQTIENTNKNLGTYSYYVRDSSTKGWRFVTDKKYKVGDVISITVKE